MADSLNRDKQSLTSMLDHSEWSITPRFNIELLLYQWWEGKGDFAAYIC